MSIFSVFTVKWDSRDLGTSNEVPGWDKKWDRVTKYLKDKSLELVPAWNKPNTKPAVPQSHTPLGVGRWRGWRCDV